MAQGKEKRADEVIARWRAATNRDVALDSVAAEHLGVSATDLLCLNIVENRSGLTAGELAAEAGLTTGAVTGVIDRLERAGYARRRPDATDRRKVLVEVTDAFYMRAEEVWGPIASDWMRSLSGRFTIAELETIAAFLAQAEDLAERHAQRLRGT